MPMTEHELEALWVAAFGQPPPIRASAECLVDYLIRYLPAAPCYLPNLPAPAATETCVAVALAEAAP